MKKLKNKLSWRKIFIKYNIYLILLAFIVIACAVSKDFRTYQNLTNLLSQVSVIGILAIGQTIVLITGGFDLSYGSYVALSSVLIAIFMQWGIFAALLMTLLCLLFLGAFNAFFINRGVVPLITTLGMTGIARSLALFLSNSDAVSLPHPEFEVLAYGTILDIPFCVFLWLFLVVIFALMLKHTRVGRHIYAVGGNIESARLSGVNVKMIMYVTYMISAFCAVAAGAVYTARLGVALPDKAVGYEMDSIASSVIGGASLAGGIGSLDGTLIGVLIYGTITNFLNIIGVSAYWQQVVKGLIIAIAVYINTRQNAHPSSEKKEA